MMNRYDKYKLSGIEWIGEIPEHWELKKLKHITYLKARVGWHGLKADEFLLDEDLPYCITGTDFYKGIINWETCYHISEERYNEDTYIQLKENDLLVTKDGTIGKVAVVKKLSGKAILNSGVFVMRPTFKQYNSEFMYWLVQSEAFREFVKHTSRGSTIIHLYQDTFLNWPISLPPIKEQTAIASYLNKKTAQIDKLIANKQQLIELLKEERTAIINKAVNGEGMNYERKKLSHGFKIIGSGTTPTSGDETYYNGTTNWLQTGDLNDGEINATNKKITEKALKDYSTLKEFSKGSLVIAMYGATIGKVGILNITTTTNQACCVMSEAVSFNVKYVYYWFVGNKEFIVSQSYGGGQPNISQELIRSLRLPCPPLNKQASIVQHIQTQTQRINNIISKIEKEIALINEYRTALISEVITGKLKVTDTAVSIVPSKQATL